MAWTETARRQYERRKSRYASVLTDAEWSIIEPLMPAPRRVGRLRETDLREVVNALLSIALRVVRGGFCRRTFHRFPRC